MNKTKFISLILVMLLSLIGMIGIQGYWIRSVIFEKSVQFEENVNNALEEISQQLQSDEVEDMLSRFSGLRDLVSPNFKELNFTYSSQVNKGESISFQQKIQEEVITIPLSRIAPDNNDSIRIRNYFDYSKLLSLPVYSEGSKLSVPYTISYLPQDDNLRLGMIRSQVNIIGDRTPISQRVDSQKLIQTIDTILYQHKITTPYQYGILTNGELSSVHSPRYEEAKNAYKAALFPSPNSKTKYELVLKFPFENVFLVRAIFPMIGMSVVFIIIIVITFAYSLYHMINQKRVADIKNDFINNMTHEFKTPIATINIATDAIRSPWVISDKSKIEHYISIIKEENKRMLNQVESVLRIAKLERGQMELSRIPLSLNAILEEALDHIELIVAQREGTIEEVFQAEKDQTDADPMHIMNVFVNLLDNANKYSPDKPQIKVSTYNSANYWVLEVSDKGMGMSEVELKKIFEKFYRSTTGNIHNIKGHGLGLAYAKKIIELHGGNIIAVSHKGEGSTFTVKIPLIESITKTTR